MGVGTDEIRVREVAYSRVGIALWTLLGAVLLTFKTGYSVEAGSNHPLQLIVVQKILNPQLYPNDFFVNQSWQAYTSILWSLVAFLRQWFSLEVIFAVFFLLNRLLLSFAAVYAALCLFGNRVHAPVVGLLGLLTLPHPFIGDGDPVRNSVEQTGYAYGLGILAILGLIQGKGWLVSLALAGCFCFNAMYGGFAVIYLLATLGFTPTLRVNWWHWLKWIGLGIALGVPGWLPTLMAGSRPYDVEAAWKISEIAYPWHFYMVSKRANILFPAFVILTFLLVRRSPILLSSARAHLLLWTGIAVFFYLVAHLAPFISLTLLRVHPIRGHEFWHFAAVTSLWGHIVYGVPRWIEARPNSHVFARAWGSIIVLVLCVVGSVPEILRFMQGGGIHKAIFNQQSWEVRRVAEWAQKNTCTEDVFLVPISMGGPWAAFRHLSQRNVYLHWKDITGWPYAIWCSSEFLQRLRALGFFEKNGIDETKWRKGDWIFRRRIYYLQRNYKIEESDVLRVIQKYRIDYWIVEKEIPTRFPVVYQDETVKVVRVSGSHTKRTVQRSQSEVRGKVGN